MLEFEPLESDVKIERIHALPDLVDKVEGVSEFTFLDKDGNINAFNEFPSLLHVVKTVENLNENHELSERVSQSVFPHWRDDDGNKEEDYGFHYDGEYEWSYGTVYKDRIATRDALLHSSVDPRVWEAMKGLEDSILRDQEVKRLMELAPSTKRMRHFGTSGDDLCIDRVLGGDPRHWSYMSKGMKNNIIRIGINVSVSCMNDEDVFYKMCAIASVAADLVYKADCALEFYATMISRPSYEESGNPYKDEDGNRLGGVGNGFQGFFIRIKGGEEMFSLSRIACLGIPGLFRHYGFHLKTLFASGKFYNGLGTSVEKPDEVYSRFGLDHVIEYSHADDHGAQVLLLKNIFADLSGMDVDGGIKDTFGDSWKEVGA
jgi:hypothetical protein